LAMVLRALGDVAGTRTCEQRAQAIRQRFGPDTEFRGKFWPTFGEISDAGQRPD